MQLFSTDDVQPRERFPYWREVLTQHFLHLRPERIKPGTFSSSIRAGALCGHSFSEVSGGVQRVYRSRSEIARSPYDLVFINVQLRSNASYRQNGEETALRPGDVFIIDATRPFELGCPEPMTQLSLKIPRPLSWAKRRNADDAPGAFISKSTYVGRLLGGYISSLWRENSIDPDRSNKDAIDHLVELAAYELDRRRGAAAIPRRAICAAVFARAKRFIEVHSCDPGLTPSHIASAMGVSLRTLQSIFAAQQSSISSYVQKARITKADKSLSNPAMRNMTIGEIAFSAGFKELSHFTHSFVREFGETPSARRRRMPA